MGLISGSLQGEVYQFDLVKEANDNGGRLMDHDFNERQLKITSAVNVPGRKHDLFAVGNDSKIHYNQTPRDPHQA